MTRPTGAESGVKSVRLTFYGTLRAVHAATVQLRLPEGIISAKVKLKVIAERADGFPSARFYQAVCGLLSKEEFPVRSDNITAGRAHAEPFAAACAGMTDEEIRQPIIGVVSAYSRSFRPHQPR